MHLLSSSAVVYIVDPQVKRDLQRQLGEAQEKYRLVQEEEKALSEEERKFQTAHKEFKDALVSSLPRFRLGWFSHTPYRPSSKPGSAPLWMLTRRWRVLR